MVGPSEQINPILASEKETGGFFFSGFVCSTQSGQVEMLSFSQPGIPLQAGLLGPDITIGLCSVQGRQLLFTQDLSLSAVLGDW